ncbi:1-pyrroline-5-carboxylate dehydrogenase [Halorubrum alkaliphilum]|uniref:L-glutamate gamma-semialdehyde dehydrogenase n=1 Tax=Halorubrum alkaliphilum TaxID=261290 RepID=A0A8T4GG49_9EURY|nr:aldehyde dehydrogenase family protein [Halorubrum alkaliphilum]MBP1922162.1 1-pyrroline-5-carboxylate dehydrogenase [Halorubrum alkaliphilum]
MVPSQFENELTVQTHTEAGTMNEFHAAYEAAVEDVRAELGDTHPLWIDGEAVETDETFTVRNPGDADQVVGEFAAGDETNVDAAVAAASTAFDEWKATSIEERTTIFRDAADRIADRKYEIAAMMAFENGKNRNEAMAEVDEAIDFLRYYSHELEKSDGYGGDVREPTPGQRCVSDLQPYGVFGIVAPFNFPFAILVGMTTGALITGNTAVVKPASTTPLVAHTFFDILQEAGLPDGVANLVTGGGRDVGQPMIEHENVAGFAFTGSRRVGLKIQETFDELDKRGPVIAELGGKNPVIVSDEADISKAVSGVKYGAFSFSGQKCSATSRVYVHEDVAEEFTEQLIEETKGLAVGQPETQETVVSPLIDEGAIERYDDICESAAADGTVECGGSHVERSDLPEGRYVEPTVVTGLSHDHALATDEHFLPFVTVHPVSDLDEAITKSNDSDYALCAGLFTEDDAEVDTWFDRIEAGMCYVNREQSATTGALVEAQPFGGWKYSGTTGKFAGGPWYLQQFMRQQTRTVVGDIGEP